MRRPVLLATLLAPLLVYICLCGCALADDLENAQPQLDMLKAAVAVLESTRGSTSQACNDQLNQWKSTMEAIHYDTVHHDSDLPVARDVLAMNYADGARLCGQDAARVCLATPSASGCKGFAAAIVKPSPAP